MKHKMNQTGAVRHVASAGRYLALISAFLLCGCMTIGNGVMREVKYAETPTQTLSVKGNWVVNVVCNAPTNMVTISAEDNLWNDISVSCGRGNIRVATSGNLRPTLPMTVTVQTTADIEQLTFANSASASVQNPHRRCSIDLSNNSELNLTGCALTECEIDMSNSSSIKVSGNIRKLDLNLSNNSRFEATAKLSTVECNASNNSSITFAEAALVTAQLSNSSALYITDLTQELKGNASNNSEIKVGGSGGIGDFRLKNGSQLNRL